VLESVTLHVAADARSLLEDGPGRAVGVEAGHRDPGNGEDPRAGPGRVLRAARRQRVGPIETATGATTHGQ